MGSLDQEESFERMVADARQRANVARAQELTFREELASQQEKTVEYGRLAARLLLEHGVVPDKYYEYSEVEKYELRTEKRILAPSRQVRRQVGSRIVKKVLTSGWTIAGLGAYEETDRDGHTHVTGGRLLILEATGTFASLDTHKGLKIVPEGETSYSAYKQYNDEDYDKLFSSPERCEGAQKVMASYVANGGYSPMRHHFTSAFDS